MATTLYGLPAVEVEQPDGEIVRYLVEPTPALPATEERPAEWRAWFVRSPEGNVYRVSEFTSGRFGCNCPAHTLGKNRGGRWQEVKKWPCCKHIRGVWDELKAAEQPVESPS
jgi:hypothetical protein